MAWTIEYDPRALRDLRKLPDDVQRRIVDYMDNRVAVVPRSVGDALTDVRKLWRYRVGDYRIICRIEDKRVVVLVVQIGHRREVYR